MQSESKLTHCAHHHQTHNNIYTNLDIDMNLTKPNLSLVTYRVSSLYNAIVPAGRPCVSSSMTPPKHASLVWHSHEVHGSWNLCLFHTFVNIRWPEVSFQLLHPEL